MVVQGGNFWAFLMRDIRDKLFKEEGEGYVIFEKKEALNRKHFYGAGLFFGKYAKPTETPVSFSLEHTRISIYLFIAGFSL